MTVRTVILDAARDYASAHGRLPSLDVLAAEAGVSKGGLMHHFSSRASLVAALIVAVLDETDREMRDASARGEVVDTWLRLSAQPVVGGTPLTTLAVITFGANDDLGDTVEQIRDATERWESLLAAELGSLEKARMVRLIGDGMLLGRLIDDRAPVVTAEQVMAVLGRAS